MTYTTLDTTHQDDLNTLMVDCTASVVAAFVGRNEIAMTELPNLISTVYTSLSTLGKTTTTVTEKPVPAVEISASVFPDYIVCLEDGKKLKMLKRHLQTSYKMTPEQYRAKWGLSPDYPMTAPAYAEVRSSLAKKIGLGTSRGKAPAKTVAKTVKKAAAPRKRAAKKA